MRASSVRARSPTGMLRRTLSGPQVRRLMLIGVALLVFVVTLSSDGCGLLSSCPANDFSQLGLRRSSRSSRQAASSSGVLSATLPHRSSLTIWTILRDFATTDPFGDEASFKSQAEWLEALHTYNAINSWIRLPNVDVILFGTETACAFVATFTTSPRVTCQAVPCIHPEYKTPTYDCLFAKAAELAQSEFLMYSNSDMVYFEDLLWAAHTVASQYDDFLLIGQRTDIVLPRRIDFADPAWALELRDYARAYGKPHGKYGIDYFLYRTAFAREMPPFLVGRIRWDNWLLAQYIGSQTAVAVDTTQVVFAVHLNHMKVGGSHERSGTDYNVNLTMSEPVDPKKIGDIESADFVLRPRSPAEPYCPECVFVRNEQSLDVMLFKQASRDTRSVIVATVNSGYLDFAMNWQCSLRRVGITNYLFHATDRAMYESLSALGQPVIYYESAPAIAYKQSDAGRAALANRTDTGGEDSVAYGSVAYQALMNTRTEFIYKILQKGYNVLLCDVDIVFLRNPFPYFNESLDIQGGAHKQTKLTGGYVYFRATEPARQLWVKVLLQHRELFKQIQEMESFNPHSMTEQELLNSFLTKAKPDEIAWGTVDEKIIADGKRFFIDHLTQQNGEWPAAIHNNYIIGADNKRERFLNTSLWFVRDDFTCKPFPAFQHQPPSGSFSLTIKVLAFNRPKALYRLLESLLAASYDGDSVSLEIFIDYPDPADVAADPDLVLNRSKVVRMAELFVWPHGRKAVHERQQHFGLAQQWLSSWFPTGDSELCLFLEDDNIVSPHYYQWLKKAANKYYFDHSNYDPRLFGISMQLQHMIPGRYPTKPIELLPAGTHFFKYQLLSTWGPLFFPNHWSEFLTWFAERSSNANFMPLFSNMITNTWFLQRGGGRSVWSAWFMRFAAERGYYTLYTSFKDDRALVVNYRDKGVNYKEDKGPNSEMVTVIEPYMEDFPPSADLPIYDFHFNKIEDPNELEDRAIYSDIYNIQTH